MNYATTAALAAVLLTPGMSWAQAQEWTCPSAEKVGLLPTTPGWLSQDTVMYPYQAPVLRLESMEYGPHGPGATCKYRVEGSGLISIWKFGKCENGKGTWKPVGPKSTCETAIPAECSLICTPV